MVNNGLNQRTISKNTLEFLCVFLLLQVVLGGDFPGDFARDGWRERRRDFKGQLLMFQYSQNFPFSLSEMENIIIIMN